MSIPDVTVIVPVYNTLPYLTACLDSLVHQSIGASRMQVVAVDDGSTDGSGEELDDYAQRYPDRFVVVHQTNSGGPARPCNVALDRAEGRYVLFLGADDYLDLEALERMVEAADRWSSDVLCARVVGVNGRWVNQRLFEAGDRPVQVFPSAELASALSNTKLFRRSLLENHGIRYELDMSVGSDQPFTIDAMRHASVISVLADRPYYFAVRRDDGENITYSSTWRERLAGMRSIMEHVAVRLPAGETRDVVLLRHLSGEMATLLRRDFGGLADDERRALVAGVNGVTGQFLTEWIRERLRVLARLRYALAAREDFAQLQALIGAEDGEFVLLADGTSVQHAPVAWASQVRDRMFQVAPDEVANTLRGAFRPGRARFEGSELVIEGACDVLAESGENVRCWLSPAANRAGWGTRSVPRVPKPPPRSHALDLRVPGHYSWRLDLAPLIRPRPGTAWMPRIEIDAGDTTWRLPVKASLDSSATYQHGDETILVRALGDASGNLLFELLDAKELHDHS